MVYFSLSSASNLIHRLNRNTIVIPWLLTLASCLALASCSSNDTDVVVPPQIDPNLPIGHRYPRWSVNGDSLYYYDVGVIGLAQGGGYKVDPDSVGIRVVASTGGAERIVLGAKLSTFTLSPDGSAMCIALSGNLFVGAIVSGRLNSVTLEQITTIGGASSPSWAPGDWIAFDSDYEDPKGAQAIWKVRADGTGLTDLSTHGTGEWLMASWNSDGTKIVHVRYVSDTPWSEIFVMDANGSNSKRLTRNNSMDLHPNFAPDGNHICYQSQMKGIDTIHIMNADGTGDRAVATGILPVWSPSSDEIAYVALTANPKTNGTIWLISVDGSKKVQVTRTRY